MIDRKLEAMIEAEQTMGNALALVLDGQTRAYQPLSETEALVSAADALDVKLGELATRYWMLVRASKLD